MSAFLFDDEVPAVDSVVIADADLINGHSAEDIFVRNSRRIPEGA
jgi:hypothetical protein